MASLRPQIAVKIYSCEEHRGMDQRTQSLKLKLKNCAFMEDVPTSPRLLVFINKWHCIEVSEIYFEFHIRIRFNKLPF